MTDVGRLVDEHGAPLVTRDLEEHFRLIVMDIEDHGGDIVEANALSLAADAINIAARILEEI